MNNQDRLARLQEQIDQLDRNSPRHQCYQSLECALNAELQRTSPKDSPRGKQLCQAITAAFLAVTRAWEIQDLKRQKPSRTNTKERIELRIKTAREQENSYCSQVSQQLKTLMASAPQACTSTRRSIKVTV